MTVALQPSLRILRQCCLRSKSRTRLWGGGGGRGGLPRNLQGTWNLRGSYAFHHELNTFGLLLISQVLAYGYTAFHISASCSVGQGLRSRSVAHLWFALPPKYCCLGVRSFAAYPRRLGRPPVCTPAAQNRHQDSCRSPYTSFGKRKIPEVCTFP